MSDIVKTHIEYGSKSFTAILWSLFFAGFASFSSLYCVQPMMPIFAKFFQVTPTHSSFPLSFSTVALAIGLLFTGFISDRFGRKPIMVCALFLVSILLLISASFPIWEIFLSTRILIGLAVSGVAAVAMTYIGEEIAQKDIGFAMGLYISGTAIGGMGGRLIAGVLVDFISWQSATYIIGFLNFIIACLFYLLLPKSQHFKPFPFRFSRFKAAFEQNLKDSKLRILFAQGFILMGCLVTVFNYISYHLLEAPFHLSQTWIGLISIAYLAGIYSSPKAAQWGYQYGRAKVLPFLLFSMMVGLFITLIPSLWAILLGLTIFTFSFFAAHSTASSWVSVQAVQYRAVASSLYLFCYYIGSSLLGSSGGLVWEHFGWIGINLSVGVVLVIGFALAIHLMKNENKTTIKVA
ncbi:MULTISPECIES: MFS transporter [unclassified Acinetobacter]|uniref:MFS transporter n=1 Tax=unclassified Acinetobacter TaxID=196816 RepID=UPI00201B0DED|nr:MFS transporter [Acinetobacter sp. ANC5681]MCL5767904.1 MFS transporter [Acinetobacter sp. ANC5681]